MGSGRDLSPRKKGQLRVYLDDTTLSCHEIADKLGISVRSVFNIKKKLKNGDSLSSHRVGKCGRKPVSSPRQDRMLVAMMKKRRSTSSKDLANTWKTCGVQCSPSTVRRRLCQRGFHACRPMRVPRLTEAMKKKRLAWAKAHRHWTSEDWKKVITDCFVLKMYMNCS